MQIELVWIDPSGSVVTRLLDLDPGACLRDALAAIDIPELAASLDRGELQPAVFGRLMDPGSPLAPNDRIELLAALRVDPKAARRRRAEVRRRQAAQPAPDAQR